MTSSANTEGEGDEQFLPYGPPTEVDERPPLNRKTKGERIVEPTVEEESESMAEDLMDDASGCPANLHQVNVDDECESIREWSLMVRELYKQSPTFEDLGKHLYALMLMSPTPLGNFVRSYCTAAQPPIVLSPKRGTSSNLLPIPPWSVTTDIPGVTEGN